MFSYFSNNYYELLLYLLLATLIFVTVTNPWKSSSSKTSISCILCLKFFSLLFFDIIACHKWTLQLMLNMYYYLQSHDGGWQHANALRRTQLPIGDSIHITSPDQTGRGSALAPPLLAEVQMRPVMRGRCLGHPEACGQRLESGQQVGVWGVWNPGFNLLKLGHWWCLRRAVFGELKFFSTWHSLT